MAKKRKKKRNANPAKAAKATEVAPSDGESASTASEPMGGGAASGTAADPGDSHRQAANILIALFLLYSVAMPARYYLAGGGTDERFAWRMFSSVRQYSCKVDTTETLPGSDGRKKVILREVLHVAWINMLKRGRGRLDEKFVRMHCARSEAESVRLVRSCRAPDGTNVPAIRYDIDCESGALKVTTGAEDPT